MKALDYLKDDLKNIDPRKTHTIQNLKQCISELEALENRSCDNCKNNLGGYCELYESDFINIINRDIDFCCNKWESKC